MYLFFVKCLIVHNETIYWVLYIIINIGMYKKTRATTVEEYLKLISKQDNFNPKSKEYTGFIDINPQDATELGVDYSDLAYRIAMNSSVFEKTANKYGLTITTAFETFLSIERLKEKTY